MKHTGVYIVSYSEGGGEFVKSVGEEYQVLKRGRNIKAVGKNITWKKDEAIRPFL